jgi:hypothetical protein
MDKTELILSKILHKRQDNLQKYIDKQIADKNVWWAIVAQAFIELKDALNDIEKEID